MKSARGNTAAVDGGGCRGKVLAPQAAAPKGEAAFRPAVVAIGHVRFEVSHRHADLRLFVPCRRLRVQFGLLRGLVKPPFHQNQFGVSVE